MDCLKNDIFQNSEVYQLDQAYLTKTLDTNTLIFDEVIQQTDEDLTNNIPQSSESLSHIILTNPEISNERILVKEPNNISYQCEKCEKSFDKVNLYRKHLKTHQNTKRFKCDKCDVSYNLEVNLKLHLVTHNEGQLKCPVCNITFQRSASFKSHLILHHVDEYNCEECEAEFDKIEDLDKHSRTHLNDYNKQYKELVCPHCKIQFEDNKQFREHISFHAKVRKMIVSDKKPKRLRGLKTGSHVCIICRKSFTKLSLLERHMRIHSGEKPFVCEYCNKGFAQKGTLTIHLSKHKGLKPFQCALCSARFLQKGNLRNHVERTHMAPVPGAPMYKCNLCTCVFKKIASLNVHMSKSHSTNKDIGNITTIMKQLKELEKQTTTITPDMKEIDKHIIEQNKKVLQEIKEGSLIPNISYVKLLECEVNQRKYLIKQKKVNGIRFYICNYCSKEFKKPSDLIRHTRTHTKEKPFKCKLCNSAFSLKSTLFYHLDSHTRKKSHICEICKKEFTAIRALNMHMNHSHPEKSPKYKCTVCFKWFNSNYKAKLHKEMHINEKNLSHVVLKQPLLKTTVDFLTMPPPKPKAPNIDIINSLRQFQCEICKLKFSQSGHLKRHLLLHDEEKKFKCDQCSKSYVTFYGLKEHLITHSGTEKYICKICNKKYVSTSLLKRHELTHNVDKPYLCPYCNQTFKTVIMCRKHILIHKKDSNIELNSSNNLNDQSEVIQNNNQLINTSTVISNLELPIVNNNNYNNNINEVQSNEMFKPTEIFIQGDNDQELTNSIHIIDGNNLNGNDLISNENEIQILINYEDLPLLNNSNLYNNLFSQLKQQSSNTFIVGNMNDLQDNNNILTFESLTDPNPNEIYNDTNGLFTNSNNNVNDCVTLPNIEELTKKTLNNLNNSNNNGNEKTTNVDLINETNLLCDNIQFYTNINEELNLVDTNQQQQTNDEQLIVLPTVFSNLTTDSVLVFDTNNELTNNDSPNIYENTNVICTKCNKLVNLAANNIKAHTCVITTANNNDNNTETTNIVEIPDLVKDLIKSTTDNDNVIKEQEQSRLPVIAEERNEEIKKLNDNILINLVCSYCRKAFNNNDMFEKHKNNHINFCMYECNYCGKGFKKTSDRTRHIRTHTGERPFKCDKCEKKFSLKSTLDSHSRTHNPNNFKEYNCDVCNSYFSSKSSLKVHMHVHTGAKPYDCSYCPLKFRTAAHKRSHESNQHTKQQTIKKNQSKETKVTNLLATVAMEAINDNNNEINLQNSNQLNGQVVQIHCPEGDNILNESIQIDSLLLQQLQSSNLLLDDQLMTPTAIQFEDGTILNIKTEDVNNVNLLNSLTVSNNNEKPRNFECSICLKKYASKDVLRKHKKRHGINKKFPCTKCDKGFDLKDDLERHEIIHLGHMPFPCPLCKNSFAKKSNLKIHLKRIHEVISDTVLNRSPEFKV